WLARSAGWQNEHSARHQLIDHRTGSPAVAPAVSGDIEQRHAHRLDAAGATMNGEDRSQHAY
ncbi:hypothetical protein FE77_14905, partial [Staphylococcus aureus]